MKFATAAFAAEYAGIFVSGLYAFIDVTITIQLSSFCAISFAKTCANEPGGFLRRQLVVCGSKGTVQLMPLEEYESLENPGSMLVTRTRNVTEDLGNWANNGVNGVSAAYDRYDTMLATFAAFARGEGENPYTPDYELAVYKLVLRACGK